jgi:hypothetical protein
VRLLPKTLNALLAVAFCLVAAGAACAQSISVTTHHYDNQRTGWNPSETILTPSAVAGGTFQLQQTVALDQQVDAQPLLAANRIVAGVAHDVVYLATENNSVYAIDASTGAILLQTNLGASVPQSALPGGCGNNGNMIGIIGTPVIDPVAGFLYVVADVYDAASGASQYWLHALDMDTLVDAIPPVVVAAKALLTNGKTYDFTPASSRQRAALLLANGNVYAGFASFCDLSANTSRGWVLGWNAQTLAPLAQNKLTSTMGTTPDSFFLSSVWMSGSGLAASSSGDIYFVTGNSDYNGLEFNRVTNLSESVVQVSADLSTVDGLFTPVGPYGHAALDTEDQDFGSGGVLLLPPQSVSPNNLAVAAGKVGIMYLLNAGDVSKPVTDIVGDERIQANVGSCWCAPSYFTGHDGFGRVVSSGGSNFILWKVEGGAKLHLAKVATSSAVAGNQDPGFFTTVSTNGTAAGSVVIWAVGRPYDGTYDVQLYGFNESGVQLFSGVAGYWPNTGGNSNIVPVVANGRVYVASYQQLQIFGLGAGPGKVVPAVRAAAVRAALAPGQHEIYGWVREIQGSTLTIVERTGVPLTVDAEQAYANALVNPPRLGGAVVVRGSFDDAGLLLAQALMRAKGNPAIWPPDR